MQKPTFFARHAMLILIVVFFLVPFALRGSRMALLEMKNDVKDWLPSDLEETKDLEEFRRYFLSEQFVLVSWNACYGDANDERFKLFLDKLTPETPPSILAKQAAAIAENVEQHEQPAASEDKLKSPTQFIPHQDNFIGDRLGLYTTGNWHQNWADLNEKWLKGRRHEGEGPNEQAWYYITPAGDLYRWNSVDSPFAGLTSRLYRSIVSSKLNGTLVHSFGPVDGSWYHADPRRLRAALFKTVTTGPQVLASLTDEGGELAGSDELKKEAKQRLSGILYGPDGKTTCLVLTLTDSARRNLHLVCGRGMLGKPRGRLYEIANESNIADQELRMGGPPVDNVAIDEEGSITLARLVGYSAALGIGLSLICFRSISATIIVVFVGGISALMSVAMVWWTGSSVDAIMMSMPSMVYVLGLSGAAHIMNYYREAVDQHGPVGAPETAIARGWKPAFLCEVTTALGLITLITSELVPIRKFGIYSALGVMMMFVILLTYLPAALQIWPQPKRKPLFKSNHTAWLDRFLSNFWQRLGGWIINHHGLVAVGCTLLIAACGCGIAYMRTSVNMLKMFHSEAKLIKDYNWLEANLGNLVPMEIVLRVPPAEQCPSSEKLQALSDELASDATTPARKTEIEKTLQEAQFQLSFLERMELASRVQDVVEEEFGAGGRNLVGRSVSAATFVRPLPKAGGSTSARLTRSSTSGRLEAHRGQFLDSDYLRVKSDDGTELWRVSLRVSASKGVDYGVFVNNLQQSVEPLMAAQEQRQDILRQLAARRHEQGEANAPLANSKLLLIGMPAHALAKESSGKRATDPTAPVDQHKIFARALRELLTISRLRIDTPAQGARELSQNIEQTLASYDGVVILADVPGLDLSRIERSARLVIDARDHAFVPGTAQQTAWQRNPASVAAVYTGVVPIVYKAQRMLLDSLVQSTFWSIITITPLLMWIARSVSAGAVAMLPNVLPIVMIFGGMGWLGIDVDVGAMMTASIALGVAVDDTIHYLNWYREELDRLGDRKLAILAAYEHCATPTVQAALISGLGLSVFALSTFTPTQRFGLLMLTILWAGAVAELIYFPAILAGPLGKFFKPRTVVPALARAARRTDPGHEQPLVPQLQVIHAEEVTDLVEHPAAAMHREDAPGTEAKPHPVPLPAYLRHLRHDGPSRKS